MAARQRHQFSSSCTSCSCRSQAAVAVPAEVAATRVYLADCSRCGLPCSSLELRATAEAAASPAACRSGGTAHAGCRRLWRTAEVAGCCGACCMLPRLASRTAIAIAPAALTVVAAPLSDWLRLVIGIDYLEREVPREGAGWVGGQGGWVLVQDPLPLPWHLHRVIHLAAPPLPSYPPIPSSTDTVR